MPRPSAVLHEARRGEHLKQEAKSMCRSLQSLKALADHEPSTCESVAEEFVRDMTKAAKISVGDLQAARSLVYISGYHGPFTRDPDDPAGMTMRRAVRIVNDAVDVYPRDIEFHNPDYPSDQPPQMEDESDDAYYARVDQPNFRVEGSSVHADYWKFLKDIYGDYKAA
jgi:hypothetical protein